mgnify:CR=1 FL=1
MALCNQAYNNSGMMRQSPNTRRVRTRGNGKRHPSSKNFPIESNGPDVKIRGTAQQVMDKYLALARDAASAGDRVQAESYFQHADHYHRIAHSFDNGPGDQNRRRPDNRLPGSPDGPQPDIDDFPEGGAHNSGGGRRGNVHDMSLQDDDDGGDSDNETVGV